MKYKSKVQPVEFAVKDHFSYARPRCPKVKDGHFDQIDCPNNENSKSKYLLVAGKVGVIRLSKSVEVFSPSLGVFEREAVRFFKYF